MVLRNYSSLDKKPPKKKESNQGKLLTWGYQSRRIEDLDLICGEEKIKIIIDVRRLPFSQQPSWNKEILLRVYDGRDGRPKYISMPGLGNYNSMTGWIPAPNEQLLPALEQLDEAMGMNLCVLLLCKEREHVMCHRRDVADLIRTRTGCEVIHLGGKHGPVKKGEQMSFLGLMGKE